MRRNLLIGAAFLLCSCFEDATEVNTSGSAETGSTGRSDTTTSSSGAMSTSSASSTTMQDTTAGTMVDTTASTTMTTDDTGTDTGSTTDGPPAEEIIFEYQAVLCGAMVERLSFVPPTMFEFPNCGRVIAGDILVERDEGPVDLQATMAAERVVLLTAQPSPMADYESQTSISTVALQPTGDGGLYLRYRVDCVEGDGGTTQFGSVVSNGMGMDTELVVMGTHTCGDEATVVDEPIPGGNDRTISIRVDGPLGSSARLAFIDPVVYRPGS